MRRIKHRETSTQLYVNAETLAGMLEVGRATADKIGRAANAKIKIGRSARYDITRVKEYMESLAE